MRGDWSDLRDNCYNQIRNDYRPGGYPRVIANRPGINRSCGIELVSLVNVPLAD